jgi:hypothetical protein
MTLAESLKKNEELQARIAELEAAKAGRITVKMSEFGGGTVSVYGIRRFPLSFFAGEWAKIIAVGPEVDAYIAAHSNELRCAAFAKEYCEKSKVEWDSKDKENTAYKAKYAEGYAQAIKNPSLFSSKSK